ncbi:MAG: hypothetical protein ACLQO1_07380 [Steroidobacteraceae bacterium]
MTNPWNFDVPPQLDQYPFDPSDPMHRKFMFEILEIKLDRLSIVSILHAKTKVCLIGYPLAYENERDAVLDLLTANMLAIGWTQAGGIIYLQFEHGGEHGRYRDTLLKQRKARILGA